MKFDKYEHHKNLVNQLLIPDLANITISYFRDDIMKWAKNNYKNVVKDINGMSRLIEYSWMTDIKETVDCFISSYLFSYEEYEECMWYILNTKTQFCSSCRKDISLYEFNGIYKTCATCRLNKRRLYVRNKIIHEICKCIFQKKVKHSFKVSNKYYDKFYLCRFIEEYNPYIKVIGLEYRRNYYVFQIGNFYALGVEPPPFRPLA